MSHTSCTWWHNVDINEIILCRWVWRDTVTLLKKHQSKSPKDSATQFSKFKSGGLQRLGIVRERVYHLQMHDVKKMKERRLGEWRLLDHSIIAAAIVQWHSHLSACVCVNGGNFEHKFWTCDYQACFVRFITARAYARAVLGVVILSVRPSVRHTRGLWQTKWCTADIFIPHERAITQLLWYQEWLVGDVPFPLKSAFKVWWLTPLRKTPTSTDFRS